MGLRLKFNLVLVAVFLVGFAAAGLISRQLLQNNARDEVIRNARLMMEAALAARSYTVTQIKPLLDPKLDEVFLPQSVSAYAATEILSAVQKKHPGYSYKEATLNPTNPRDRTTDWEADIVQQFRNNASVTEVISERDGATGRLLYIAHPIQITNAACLACHSLPATAPASMIKLYGEANGFGWKHNETLKHWMGSTHFLTRRLINVGTEMSLHVLAYNLKRVISILGFQETMRAMRLVGA